ncbi:MAG TPA: M20 family metallopeptidase [Opitutus sp.]|nr:M20 family metallopeptidase [Opitutus sp.]
MSSLPITLPTSCEELLAQMVSFESVSLSFGGPPQGEARLAAHLESIAQRWGLQTRRCPVGDQAFNLLVTFEVSPTAEWLFFESHLDTVNVEGMTVPPFQLTPVGEKLHGRGACDTKGSGAAMLWALKAYAEQTQHPRNAGVIFSIDEEASMDGAQAFAVHELKEFLPRLRGIVVGEPTQLRPVVAHNGALRWRTITRGVAAHSADPTKGRSAIAAMLKVIAALEQNFIPLATRTDPLTGRAAASINVIRGGTAVNVIPDYCEIVCDRRLVPGETAAHVLAERDAALSGLVVEHDEQYLAPPLPPGSSAELHAWMQPAFAAARIDGAATGASYATNASHYAAAGAPVLVLGPGDIAQAHTKDEWLDRTALNEATAFYSALLQLP